MSELGSLMEQHVGIMITMSWFDDSWLFNYRAMYNPRLFFTQVPLSPSSIIWYWPNRQESNSSTWKTSGLLLM